MKFCAWKSSKKDFIYNFHTNHMKSVRNRIMSIKLKIVGKIESPK